MIAVDIGTFQAKAEEKLSMKPGEIVAEAFRDIQRQLIMSSNGAQKQQTTKWKAALWSKDSIEPAMLRFSF